MAVCVAVMNRPRRPPARSCFAGSWLEQLGDALVRKAEHSDGVTDRQVSNSNQIGGHLDTGRCRLTLRSIGLVSDLPHLADLLLEIPRQDRFDADFKRVWRDVENGGRFGCPSTIC